MSAARRRTGLHPDGRRCCRPGPHPGVSHLVLAPGERLTATQRVGVIRAWGFSGGEALLMAASSIDSIHTEQVLILALELFTGAMKSPDVADAVILRQVLRSGALVGEA